MGPKKATEDQIKVLEDHIDGRFDSIEKDLLSIRESIINTLVEENKNLKQRLSNLETRIITMESENHALQQYGRQNNIELNGIPYSVADSDIEKEVIDIFKSMDIHVLPNDIEAAHRLPSKTEDKPVIVRFVNRKFCELAFKNKKKLKQIYVNDNLCPQYKKIAWMGRKLKRANKISSTWSWKGIVHIRVDEDDNFIKLKHKNELVELFPDFVFEEQKIK